MIFFLRTERWTEVARKKNICGKPNHYSISQNWVRATQLWGTHGDTQIYTQYHVWVSFVRAPASSGRSRITAVTVAPFKPNTQGGGGRESLPNHAFLVRVHQHTLEFPREHNWLMLGVGWGVPLLDPLLWAVDSHGLFILWGLLISQGRETHTCLTHTKLKL